MRRSRWWPGEPSRHPAARIWPLSSGSFLFMNPYRFHLRTILVAVSLVAVALGVGVAVRRMSPEERVWLLLVVPFPLVIVIRRFLVGWSVGRRSAEAPRREGS